MGRRGWAALLGLALALGCAGFPGTSPYFRITIVDAETGRGIPAVDLLTTDARTFTSDSAGVVAVGDPTLFDRAVFFHVRSFGYHFEEKAAEWPGATLDVTRGGSAVLRMRRENVAERLYRVTGSGIYRDSLLTGTPLPVPPPEPGLAPAGSDSALTQLYRGELFWVWGDTSLLSYPLGIFHATAATSRLPGRGGLDPERGVAFRYFRDDGALRAMVDDAHPVIWLSALRATRDARGEERLFATYRKVAGSLETLEVGLAEFDDARGVFRLVAPYPENAPFPDGHAFRYRENGVAYLQADFDVRSRDDAESVRDFASYEAFTAAQPGDGGALERDARGRLVWGWKKAARPLSEEAWAALERSGAVTSHERWSHTLDVENGKRIVPHHGSVQWSPYRGRWISIRSQLGGLSSHLGEVYYFEADAPEGPWHYGRKVVTHSRVIVTPDGTPRYETYSFYNPVHHPEFDREGGRVIYFEGTLSRYLAKPAAPPPPGYDYNQMMYKLSLDDPRLFLPVPVYRAPGEPQRLVTREALGDAAPDAVAFYAPDRMRPGTVPVHETGGSAPRLVTGIPGNTDPVVFYCAPSQDAPPGTVPLYEVIDAGGRATYTTEAPASDASTLCHVWPASG